MAEYISKKEFEINSYDADGRLNKQSMTIAAGTKFVMTGQPKKVLGNHFVYRLDADDMWIEVTDDTLKKHFKKVPQPYPEEPVDSIGWRVRRLRLLHHLTQRQLAKKMGVSHRVIEDTERNRHDPSIFNLMNYADFFDVSLDWIVGRDEKHYGVK